MFPIRLKAIGNNKTQQQAESENAMNFPLASRQAGKKRDPRCESDHAPLHQKLQLRCLNIDAVRESAGFACILAVPSWTDAEDCGCRMSLAAEIPRSENESFSRPRCRR